ncbi:MAG TPA: GNAT family N-acetyltransferase [Thermoleophilaceae bacterium]|nr:GNAT family N-acetyltransferase [Thermoleophilaceae bacterium]
MATRAVTRIPRRRADAPAAVRHDWDALAEAAGAPPFLRPGWIDAWHRSYGTGTLELVTVRRADRLVGVLPVERRRGTLRSPANSHTPLFGAVVLDADAASALADRLLDRASHGFTLRAVDPGSEWFRALEAALATRGWHVSKRAIAQSPYVRTDGAWDDYRTTLSRKLLKELSRCRRRLEDRAEVAVEVHSTGDGLESALEEFVALEASGWKAAQGTAIVSRAESVGFYAQIAAWAADRGWLRISFLRHGGRAVATEFALDCEGVEYPLKSGFDPVYRSFGPGQLLTYEALARSFASRLSSYEFLGYDEPYKHRWARDMRERIEVTAFPDTPRGRLRLAFESSVRPRLRQTRRKLLRPDRVSRRPEA